MRDFRKGCCEKVFGGRDILHCGYQAAAKYLCHQINFSDHPYLHTVAKPIAIVVARISVSI